MVRIRKFIKVLPVRTRAGSVKGAIQCDSFSLGRPRGVGKVSSLVSARHSTRHTWPIPGTRRVRQARRCSLSHLFVDELLRGSISRVTRRLVVVVADSLPGLDQDHTSILVRSHGHGHIPHSHCCSRSEVDEYQPAPLLSGDTQHLLLPRAEGVTWSW